VDPFGVAREVKEAEQPLKGDRAGCATGTVLKPIAMVDIRVVKLIGGLRAANL
jgi:hypothetical protein